MYLFRNVVVVVVGVGDDFSTSIRTDSSCDADGTTSVGVDVTVCVGGTLRNKFVNKYLLEKIIYQS